MNEHVDGVHRDQTILFPDTLDEYVDEENPVRFIDAFVDSLDLEKLGFKHSIPSDTGRPSYDPFRLVQAICLRIPQPGTIEQETRKRMSPQP